MTTNYPSWLPPITPLSDFGTDWNGYVQHIYQIFEQDFIKSKPALNGKLVIIDNRIRDGKPECFWHLITENDDRDFQKKEEDREWGLLRCERICWIRPIIENYQDEAVLKWENKKRGKKSILLFLEQQNYLVVLNIRKTYFLVTAYYVRNHTKTKLLNEYAIYKKTASNE